MLLLVDVLSNRKLLNLTLSKRGIDCVLACDGLECVAAVKANINHFHVIFMDNIMPNMTGVQASVKLRELGYENIILGLTGM